MNLTDKEIVDARIKCVKIYAKTASKAGIVSDEVLEKAEKAWQFAIKHLESQPKTTSKR